MNQKSNKLTVPDLISVGVFTALYFVLVTVATFACALLPGVGNILLPAVAALMGLRTLSRGWRCSAMVGRPGMISV